MEIALKKLMLRSKLVVHVMSKSSSICIMSCTILACAFSVMIFFANTLNIAVYNSIRFIIFTYICIYLYLKPEKINFLDSFKIFSTGNSNKSNLKIGEIVSIFISIFNVAISVALYLD